MISKKIHQHHPSHPSPQIFRHFWKPSDTTLDAVKEATGFEFQVADPLKTMHLGVKQIERLVTGQMIQSSTCFFFTPKIEEMIQF